jgi:hypothetical protein
MTTAEAAGDDEAIRAAWAALQSTIMPAWIQRRPGTRPWAWWKFEAPERRRTVGGRIHPFDDPRRKLAVAKSDRKNFWRVAYALHRGMPRMFLMPFDEDCQRDFMHNILAGRDSEIFEPEWSYLQRHNLLLPGDSP